MISLIDRKTTCSMPGCAQETAKSLIHTAGMLTRNPKIIIGRITRSGETPALFKAMISLSAEILPKTEQTEKSKVAGTAICRAIMQIKGSSWTKANQPTPSRISCWPTSPTLTKPVRPMVVMAKSFSTSQRMSRLILVGNIPPSVAITHCPIRHQSDQTNEVHQC